MTLGAFCLQGSKLFSASFWKSKGMFSTSGFPAVVGSGPLVPGHSQIGHPTGLLDLVHGLSHGGDRRQGSQRQVVQPLLCCTGRQEKPSLIRHGLLSQGTACRFARVFWTKKSGPRFLYFASSYDGLRAKAMGRLPQVQSRSTLNYDMISDD